MLYCVFSIRSLNSLIRCVKYASTAGDPRNTEVLSKRLPSADNSYREGAVDCYILAL